MKKRIKKLISSFAISICTVFISGCFTNGNNSPNSNSGDASKKEEEIIEEPIELSSISLSISSAPKYTGEEISFTVTKMPADANTFENIKFSSLYYEFYYRIDDGEPVRLAYGKETANFSLIDEGNYEFFAKYCIHGMHNDTNGDLVTNIIKASIKKCDDYGLLYNYTKVTNDTISISPKDLLKKQKNVEIPTKIDGFEVKEIASAAFKNCSVIESVIIPQGIEKIGSLAFTGCSNIKYIVVPSSVTSIGDGCFENTNKGLYIFFEHTSLSSISGYGSYSSNFNHDLKSGQWMTSCNDYVVTNEYLVGKKVNNTAVICKYIGTNSQVTIPDTIDSLPVRGIGWYSFYKTTILKVDIPNGVENIDQYAFSGCANLADVTIPSSCKAIGTYAFSGCTSLISIKIPYGVETIDAGAFSNCSNIKYIVVPSSVTSIGDGCFENTNKGAYIFFGHTSLSSISGYGSYSSNFNHDLKSGQWFTSSSDYIVNDGILYAVKNDGLSCTVIKAIERKSTIEIPDEVNGIKVTAIMENAFKEDSFVTEIGIGKNVKTIGSYAFYNCVNCSIYSDESNIMNVGDYAFYGAKGVSISKSDDEALRIQTLGKYAFSNIKQVGVDISATSINLIDTYCFKDSKSINIESKITTIGTYAFENTYAVFFEQGISNVSGYAFKNSEAVHFEKYSDFNKFEDYAFDSASISYFELPKSFSEFGKRVFNNSQNLTRIKFNGTKSEFKSVSKPTIGDKWYTGSKIIEVNCTDGTLEQGSF